MRLRRVPAFLVATIVVLGSAGAAGVAGAAVPATARPCRVAERRLPVLASRQHKLNTQLAAVADALSRAEAAGKSGVVVRLVARSAHLQAALDEVGTAVDTIHERCG
jgi:hypothetical protein